MLGNFADSEVQDPEIHCAGGQWLLISRDRSYLNSTDSQSPKTAGSLPIIHSKKFAPT